MRIIAIDWSGAKTGETKKICLAEVAGGELLRLKDGRTREEVAGDLIQMAEDDGDMVVGLDFAFSLPRWFVDEMKYASSHALWSACCNGQAEAWLKDCASPFWGRPGKPKPELSQHFRRTENETAAVAGIRPKSVFQIGGAGAVGTGSLRGMPVLSKLHDAGFAIWPFDAPRFPLVVEIYPRLLTGAVRKSCRLCRVAYLPAVLDRGHRLFADAASSEDAFDAAVSALVMNRHAAEFESLPVARDELEKVEGAIWTPPQPVAAPVVKCHHKPL
jgi:hypothetical protein